MENLVITYKNYRIEKVQHIWEDGIFYNFMISAYSPSMECNLVYGYANTLEEAKKCIDTKNFNAY